MTTRGIRNHNPGNIKATSIDWDGTAALEDRTDEQRGEETFVVFRGPWWGIRAMAKILRNYQVRHGLKTIGQIIGRWAPPADDNPSEEYARFVADRLGVGLYAPLDLSSFDTMRKLVRAITWFENGIRLKIADPYSWEYDAGLILAGIEPPGWPLEAVA